MTIHIRDDLSRVLQLCKKIYNTEQPCRDYVFAARGDKVYAIYGSNHDMVRVHLNKSSATSDTEAIVEERIIEAMASAEAPDIEVVDDRMIARFGEFPHEDENFCRHINKMPEPKAVKWYNAGRLPDILAKAITFAPKGKRAMAAGVNITVKDGEVKVIASDARRAYISHTEIHENPPPNFSTSVLWRKEAFLSQLKKQNIKTG